MDDDTVLILVGKGSLEEKIRKKVAQNHLQDKVIFMGLRKDIPDIMNLFDLFLFPSLYEGLGIVGIEAQAAGLPCIFSDTIPMNAIVTDNVTRISLNAPIVEWVNTIQKYKKTFCRRDQSDCVKKSRYDIITETRKLEQLYSKGIGD